MAMRRGFIASGTLAYQLDLQQAVRQLRALYLDVFGKIRAGPFRRPAADDLG